MQQIEQFSETGSLIESSIALFSETGNEKDQKSTRLFLETIEKMSLNEFFKELETERQGNFELWKRHSVNRRLSLKSNPAASLSCPSHVLDWLQTQSEKKPDAAALKSLISATRAAAAEHITSLIQSSLLAQFTSDPRLTQNLPGKFQRPLKKDDPNENIAYTISTLLGNWLSADPKGDLYVFLEDLDSSNKKWCKHLCIPISELESLHARLVTKMIHHFQDKFEKMSEKELHAFLLETRAAPNTQEPRENPDLIELLKSIGTEATAFFTTYKDSLARLEFPDKTFVQDMMEAIESRHPLFSDKRKQQEAILSTISSQAYTLKNNPATILPENFRKHLAAEVARKMQDLDYPFPRDPTGLEAFLVWVASYLPRSWIKAETQHLLVLRELKKAVKALPSVPIKNPEDLQDGSYISFQTAGPRSPSRDQAPATPTDSVLQRFFGSLFSPTESRKQSRSFSSVSSRSNSSDSS